MEAEGSAAAEGDRGVGVAEFHHQAQRDTLAVLLLRVGHQMKGLTEEDCRELEESGLQLLSGYDSRAGIEWRSQLETACEAVAMGSLAHLHFPGFVVSQLGKAVCCSQRHGGIPEATIREVAAAFKRARTASPAQQGRGELIWSGRRPPDQAEVHLFVRLRQGLVTRVAEMLCPEEAVRPPEEVVP
eukprot:scaffold3.g6604.t1